LNVYLGSKQKGHIKTETHVIITGAMEQTSIKNTGTTDKISLIRYGKGVVRGHRLGENIYFKGITSYSKTFFIEKSTFAHEKLF